MTHVSWVFVGLLACAVAILIAAEWPRLSRRLSLDGRRKRERERRKRHLRVLTNDTDDFAASVQRDLAQLPTIEERDSSNGR
jgi:hypothetical protein